MELYSSCSSTYPIRYEKFPVWHLILTTPLPYAYNLPNKRIFSSEALPKHLRIPPPPKKTLKRLHWLSICPYITFKLALTVRKTPFSLQGYTPPKELQSSGSLGREAPSRTLTDRITDHPGSFARACAPCRCGCVPNWFCTRASA